MDEKKGTPKTDLEKFIEEHRDFFEKYKRIAEDVDEEMEKIARYKAEHPETYDTEYQLEVTDRFIAENPDVPYVTIDAKKDDRRD